MYNVQSKPHAAVIVALSHLPTSLLIHRQQLQLACILSAAALVPDTESFIALSQNTHIHKMLCAHRMSVGFNRRRSEIMIHFHYFK